MSEIIEYGFNGEVVGIDGRLFEVCSDGLGCRIWINADDGSAVARFNTRTGVDVHNTVTDQLRGAHECLWCTHGKPDRETWNQFVVKIDELFGIRFAIDAVKI
ncbi:hypothetical protein [Cellvibrio sp. QJXJ]|uniref:hypothetical protein n=1 Tax=Cellvibrio sp. QJXJ TaxID=2964606 RepID=UPI0021C3031E|nr:hypothetical protein [Cellvibrio sp. QJXJ]UUA75151.1 hypothetical protein NNX04_22095 [Cellvibrio sp. QJXJ]